MVQESMEKGVCQKVSKEDLHKKIKEACDRLADTLTNEVSPSTLNGISWFKHIEIQVFKPKEANENEITIKFINAFQ
jgi:hypothetical protein